MSREIIPLPPLESARGYPVGHVALYLSCSVPTVYKLLASGRLPSLALGKRRLIPGSVLIRFLGGQEPVLAGDPITDRASQLARAGGRVGGLARARKAAAP